jgi:hypothetical protein
MRRPNQEENIKDESVVAREKVGYIAVEVTWEISTPRLSLNRFVSTGVRWLFLNAELD